MDFKAVALFALIDENKIWDLPVQKSLELWIMYYGYMLPLFQKRQ